MDSVASRYAIALLGVAREENAIQKYIDEVEQMIQIFNDNKDLSLLLRDYGLSVDEKKETIDLCFKGKINQYILNLLYVVLDNRRGGYILDILKEFDRISLNELNIRKGVVYTTISLSKQEISAMEKKVSAILHSNVTLTNCIDPTIVGGFKIQVDDYILDDSMKNRLEKLKETISAKKGENN